MVSDVLLTFSSLFILNTCEIIMVAVCFVCLGNICRSPAAEGVLKHLVEKDPELKDVHVESCGIGDWHIGQPADSRMKVVASERGYDLNTRAQQFEKAFFDSFDYILAADHEILNDLYRYAKTPEQKAKVSLITAFSAIYPNIDVPDPYFGGKGDFDLVLDILEDSCEGLILKIKKHNV